MKIFLKSAMAIAVTITAAMLAPQASAQIVFYEHDNFGGRSFTTENEVRNFQKFGFNDRASSVAVLHGRWEACEDAQFRGRCIVLRPGRYPALAAMGMNNRISSVRMIREEVVIAPERYAPEPIPVYDNHRRRDERLFQANVLSVHAVVGPPEKRCWVEHQQVVTENQPNAGGAVVGALLGGILGHQVGGGRGKDLATVGGAVAGATIGANAGGGQQVRTQEVERCANVPNQAKPEYWDVTYEFRGLEHRIQTAAPPGRTVTVNEAG